MCLAKDEDMVNDTIGRIDYESNDKIIGEAKTKPPSNKKEKK